MNAIESVSSYLHVLWKKKRSICAHHWKPKREEWVSAGIYIAGIFAIWSAVGLLNINGWLDLEIISPFILILQLALLGAITVAYLKTYTPDKASAFRFSVAVGAAMTLALISWSDALSFVQWVFTIPFQFLRSALFAGALYLLFTRKQWKLAIYGVLMMFISLSIFELVRSAIVIPLVQGLTFGGTAYVEAVVGMISSGAIFLELQKQVVNHLFGSIFIGLPIFIHYQWLKEYAKDMSTVILGYGTVFSLALIVSVIGDLIVFLLRDAAAEISYISLFLIIDGGVFLFGLKWIVVFWLFGWLSQHALVKQGLIST